MCCSQASEHGSLETTKASCRITLSIDVLLHNSHCSDVVQNAMLFLKYFFHVFFKKQDNYSGPWCWCKRSLQHRIFSNGWTGKLTWMNKHHKCTIPTAIALLTHKREVLLLKQRRLVWSFGHSWLTLKVLDRKRCKKEGELQLLWFHNY